MAFVLLYILPVLLAFVFIPKQSESTASLETDGMKSGIATELAEEAKDGLGQKSRSYNDKTRHGRRHQNKKIENSETLTDSDFDVQETGSDDQANKNLDEETEDLMDYNDGVKNADDDVLNDSNGEEEVTDVKVTDGDNEEKTADNGNEELIDNDNDAIHAKDDAIDGSLAEIGTTEPVIQFEHDDQGDLPESSSQRSDTDCPTCTEKTLTEKEMKIELVKQHLLQKLGLSSAPEVDGPLPPLPFDFYVGEDFSVNDDVEKEKEATRNNVKTRQIFIFGEDITDKCAKTKSTGCYSFNTTSSYIDQDLVSSIELWIYKQPDVNDHHIQDFMVSELEPYIKGGKEVLRFRNIVKRIETRLKYGWMKIYVRRSVIRWLSKPHRNHGLAVVCKTCQRKNHKTIYGNKEGYMPILVFYMKQNARSLKRYRRHAHCIEGGMNCCHKEELEINFRDIGWNYIMTPETIRPNFCTGSCNDIRAAHYNHTRLMHTLRQSVVHNFASIQSCCSPVSFVRPQSLLYRDNFGVVRKVDVPDLIVGECGCT